MLQIRRTIWNFCRLIPQYSSNPQRQQLIHRWVAPTLHELYKRRQEIGPEPPQPRSTYLEWNYEAEIYAFGKRLNEPFNRDLLKQALTNKSYTNRKEGDEKHNEELIKEGDTIITNFIQTEYNKYPEDVVKALQQYLTTNEMLSHIAKHIGLTDIILSAEFPIDQQTLADTFKAIIATLKHSTNQQRTELFLKDFLLSQLNGKEIYDIWLPNQPYEYLQQLINKQIEARLCQQSATNSILANYQIGLYTDDRKLLGIGWGESIEIARNTAALDAIQRIHNIRFC